jgi:predicted ATPase
MQINSIEIKNFRLFRHAELKDMPRLAVVVGANGSGKSTLFDVFSFLKDALAQNVAVAVARRGGFRELVSRGETGPISITVKFRESGGRLATYQLDIGEESGRPLVDREVLKFRRGQHGQPWHFVISPEGKGPPSPMNLPTARPGSRLSAKNMFWKIPGYWPSKAWVSSRSSGWFQNFAA